MSRKLKYLVDAPARDGWRARAKEAGALAVDADADIVLVRPAPIAVSGKRLRTKDDVAKFLAAAPAEVRELAADEMDDEDMSRIAMPVIISDVSEDRDRDVVVPSGGDFSLYMKNPVMLFGHDHYCPAIGNGQGVHVAGDEVRAIALFSPPSIDEFGAMIGKLYEAAIMRAISIGFIPKEWTFESDRGPYAMRYLAWELIEFSAVNVGSNRNALSQARGLGIDVAPALKHFSKLLDDGGPAAAGIAEAWRLIAPEKTFSLPALRSEIADLALVVVDPAVARAEAKAALGKPPAPAPIVEAPVVIVDWQIAAAALGKIAGADAFARAVRASTYGKTKSETEARAKDAEEAAATVVELLSTPDVDDADDDAPEKDAPQPDAPAPVDKPDAAVKNGSETSAVPLDLARFLALAEKRLA